MSRRVALVTGSSRGIGRAILERLADDHDCVVHYRRDRESAEQVARELTQRGVGTLVAQADLGEAQQVESLVRSVKDSFGRLDTVVASAASTKFAPVLSLRPHHVEKTFATVIASLVELARGTAELHAGYGRIVLISGLDAHFAQSGHGLLGAAKAALESLSRSLAVELGPRQVTVNSVIPGAIQTDSLDAYFGDHDDARRAMIEGTPVGRLGEVADIAHAVAFLCSEPAGFITGQALTVDGGASAEGGGWSRFRDLWA